MDSLGPTQHNFIPPMHPQPSLSQPLNCQKRAISLNTHIISSRCAERMQPNGAPTVIQTNKLRQIHLPTQPIQRKYASPPDPYRKQSSELFLPLPLPEVPVSKASASSLNPSPVHRPSIYMPRPSSDARNQRTGSKASPRTPLQIVPNPGFFEKSSSHKVANSTMRGEKKRIQFTPQLVFEGSVQKGCLHGKGRLIYDNKFTFEGEWRNGQVCGEGEMTTAHGHVLKGKWEAGLVNGRGTYMYPSRVVYEGGLKQNTKHGQGELMFPEDSFVFSRMAGRWIYDAMNGVFEIKMKFPSARSLELCFVNDVATVDKTICPYCQEKTSSASVQHCYWVFDSLEGIMCHEDSYPLGAKKTSPFVMMMDVWLDALRLTQEAMLPPSISPNGMLGRSAAPLAVLEETCRPPEKPFQRRASHADGQNNDKYPPVDRPDLPGVSPLSDVRQFKSPSKVVASNSRPEMAKALPDPSAVKQVYRDFAEFQGRKAHCKCNGFGVIQFCNGAIYEGDWVDDKPHGMGQFTNPQLAISYKGSWNAGRAHGHGTFTFPDGSIYRGQFDMGYADGQGHLQYVKTFVSYEGQWKQDKGHGQGTLIAEDGTKYELDWANGKATSTKAIITLGDKKASYIGGLKDGYFYGHGICTFPDQTRFDGVWTGHGFAGSITTRQASNRKKDDNVGSTQYALLQREAKNGLLLSVVSKAKYDKVHAKLSLDGSSEDLSPPLSKFSHDHDIIFTDFSSKVCWKPKITPLPRAYLFDDSVTFLVDVEAAGLRSASSKLLQRRSRKARNILYTKTDDNAVAPKDVFPLKSICLKQFVRPKITPIYETATYTVVVPKFILIPISRTQYEKDPSLSMVCHHLYDHFLSLQQEFLRSPSNPFICVQRAKPDSEDSFLRYIATHSEEIIHVLTCVWTYLLETRSLISQRSSLSP